MQHLTSQLTRSLLRRLPHPARKFSQTGILPNFNNKLEEEKLSGYSPDSFYPVKIGDVFHSRYQMVGKLGFGGHSTVWLGRDLQKHAYVTLKMFQRDSSHGSQETELYKHLRSVKSSHTGSLLVRHATDDFRIGSAGESNSYQCLVHPPLAMSLSELRRRAGDVLPEDVLKPTLIHLLLALDFLHTEAKIVHTDIQEDNIMLNVEDESILVDFEEAEKSSPSARKVIGDRVMYSSRRLAIPKVHGRPILSDFGEARLISSLGKQWEDVQPLVYRAPEVLLRMPWDEKIDIWNIGALAWNLFERENLFYARDFNGEVSDSHHLAGMIAILGLPPKEMLQNCKYATKFFDSHGKWRDAVEIPSTSLKKIERNLQGAQQELFLGFMRKTLQWQPDHRPSARELLADPWLRST